MNYTKEDILGALGKVEDPDLKKDLVTLGMIQNLDLQPGKVKFTLVLTTPACPLKEMLKNACITAIKEFVDKHLEVEVELSSRVTTQRQQGEQVLSGIKNIIAVASGKGGVGKSTVAVNLALGLAKSGASVGLLDADIHGPSVPVMLGVKDQKPGVRNGGNGKEIMVPVEKHGLKILSMGMLVPEDQPLIWRGPMVSNALKQMMLDVDWGKLDYLVIDLPPGTGDIHLTLLTSFPITGVVVVTTPQKVALADTQKSIEMMRNPQINTELIGVVENMAWFSPIEAPQNRYYLFGRGGGEFLSNKYNIPLLAQIPLFQGVTEDADEGTPALLRENAVVQRPFLEMTARVAQQISVANAKGPATAVG